MKTSLSHRFLAPFLSLALLAATGARSLAAAGPTEPVSRGTAQITLDSTLVAALNLASVNVLKLAPATYSKTKGLVAVTLIGGAVDTATANSEFITSGGIQFTKGTDIISLTGLILTVPGTSGTANVSADVTVNGTFNGRLQLTTFAASDLGLTTPIAVPKSKKLVLQKASLKLSAAGATALNTAVGLSVFSAGQTFGDALLTISFGAKPL